MLRETFVGTNRVRIKLLFINLGHNSNTSSWILQTREKEDKKGMVDEIQRALYYFFSLLPLDIPSEKRERESYYGKMSHWCHLHGTRDSDITSRMNPRVANETKDASFSA